MSGKIVILGVFVADATFRADRMPRMGETLIGNSFALGPGGKGSNQAVAAARSGGETHFITKLGRDTFADLAFSIWAEADVTPHVSRHHDQATGAAFIYVDENTGNNAIIICPGVAETISPDDVGTHTALITSSDVFLTQFEQPMAAAHRALELARSGGSRTILNPAPATDFPESMLGLCDFITPNETEAAEITGQRVGTLEEAELAARSLRDSGAGAAIITLGENGALYHDGSATVHVPAITAGPLVETTGAGDAFNGGFATALSEGMDPVNAVRFGNATAALSVTRAGTAPSMPKRAEIDALLKAQT